MNVTKYETANSWLSAMHEEGHGVSIMLCQAIERIMKSQKITFPEAYTILNKEKRINCVNGDYELSASE
jgi:hypothetical protein